MAERDARRLRHTYARGQFPVPVQTLAQSLDVQIWVDSALPAQRRGVVLAERDADPVMRLSSCDGRFRQRVTAATLLGHVVRHLVYGADLGYFYAMDRVPTRSVLMGAYSAAFAAELLVPETELRTALLRGDGLFDLSRRFDVAVSTVRSRVLGLA